MLTIFVIVLRRSLNKRQEACQRLQADQTTPTPPTQEGKKNAWRRRTMSG